MIKIDFSEKRPIYKQLVEQILSEIKEGKLRPGEKLPAERDLAAALEISRGTVKKAYQELADNNIIEMIQGSGSYVYNDRSAYDLERRKLALGLIDETLDRLTAWELSQREIAALFRMSLIKREPSPRTVRIALIDCNPESLGLFKRQLGYIPGIAISIFLLDSILLDDDPASLLSDFDLAVTTVTHYEPLHQALAHMDIKLLPVDMSPSKQTIVSISTLPPECSVGIITRSNKFAFLIQKQLELFTGRRRVLPVHFETDAASSARFMRRFDAVIAAPDLLVLDPAITGAAEEYIRGGGRIIPFDYTADRASLIHVEEYVDAAVRGRDGVL